MVKELVSEKFDKPYNRTIVVAGRLETDNTADLYSILLEYAEEDSSLGIDDRDPINLFIDSVGGYISSSWKLIDLIGRMKTPVYTYCTGSCESCAALLFLSGEKRFMSENSHVMIHDISTSCDGKISEIFNAVDYLKVERTQLRNYILRRTKISEKELDAILTTQKDKYIYLPEAIEKGIATDPFPEF